MTTALLIVDMLNDFVDGTLANPASTATVEPVKRLAEAARSAGWPSSTATTRTRRATWSSRCSVSTRSPARRAPTSSRR